MWRRWKPRRGSPRSRKAAFIRSGFIRPASSAFSAARSPLPASWPRPRTGRDGARHRVVHGGRQPRIPERRRLDQAHASGLGGFKRDHGCNAGQARLCRAARALRRAVRPVRLASRAEHGGRRPCACDRKISAKSWQIDEVAIKPIPACHFAHASADAAVALSKVGQARRHSFGRRSRAGRSHQDRVRAGREQARAGQQLRRAILHSLHRCDGTAARTLHARRTGRQGDRRPRGSRAGAPRSITPPIPPRPSRSTTRAR